MQQIKAVLLILLVSLIACTSEIPEEDIYHVQTDYTGSSIARNMEFSTDENGLLDGKAIGDDASVPMTMDLGGGSAVYYPDVPGSQNIKIKVLEEVGYTRYAGLIFTQEVHLNIWENGIIEVDQEGIECKDLQGQEYISKKGNIDGKSAIIMVKK